MESHHPAKFGDHRQSDSGDVFSLLRNLLTPRD